MSHRKKQHEHSEPTPEETDEMMQQMSMLAMTIEAAGGFDRAMRLTNMTRDAPEKVKEMRSFVPASRGGDDDSADKEEFWRELIQETTGSLEGRRVLHEMREELNELEIEQAEQAAEKPDSPEQE